jgi:serine O-acetyltransferase
MHRFNESAVIKSVTEAVLADRDKSVSGLYPDKAVIKEIIDKLQYALFPEYFGSEHRSLPEYGVGAALEEASRKLENQISLVLKSSPEYREKAGTAWNTVLEFLQKIPIIREYLLTDVDAAYEGDPAAYSKAEIIISYPGLYAVMVQRIAHELYLLSVPLIPRIMTEHAHCVTGIDIHPGASIGKYFFIDHGTGAVIGETAVIGNHVKIYHGVTLGALSTRGGQLLKGVKRHPTLEDYVTIYSGASILGGDTVIGKNVTIGGNVFVTKSIPDRTRVSVKYPELQFQSGSKKDGERAELDQHEFWDFVI